MNDSNPNQNPLAGHFRAPVLYLELPSRGEYYPEGALDLPENGEVPIYSMTAKDEIAMNTPDSLMSGASTAQLIQSCVPNIKDGFAVPTVDVDPLLIAIRIASSGEKLDFTNVCPSCKEENTYEVDLRNILDDYKYVDFSKPLELPSGLKFYFKPQLFREVNKVGIKTFQEQRAIAIIENEDMVDEEKLKKFEEYLHSVSVSSVDITGGFINVIVMPDGQQVTERQWINDFLANVDKNVYHTIEEKILSYSEYTKPKPLDVICRHCKHEYKTPLEFEATNFFG